MKKHKRRIRYGLSMMEVVVAAILVIAMMTFLTTLTAKIVKIWQTARHYQLATNELSNQLVHLSSISPQERDAELSELSVSPSVQQILPGARLESQIIADLDGVRIVLAMHWERGIGAKPITLTGWLDALPVDSNAQNVLVEQFEIKTATAGQQ